MLMHLLNELKPIHRAPSEFTVINYESYGCPIFYVLTEPFILAKKLAKT